MWARRVSSRSVSENLSEKNMLRRLISSGGIFVFICMVQPLRGEESQHQTDEKSSRPNIVFAIADD